MTRRRGPKAPPAVAAKATEGEGTTEVNLDAVARAERRCLSCAVDPLEGDHLSWCPDAMPTVGEAERDARDLEPRSSGSRRRATCRNSRLPNANS
jgi:hypothetical protein